MKGDELTQCLIEKDNNYQVSWIEKRLANVGNILKIKDEDGWKIIQVYSDEDYKKLLNVISQQHKNTRKVSDI